MTFWNSCYRIMLLYNYLFIVWEIVKKKIFWKHNWIVLTLILLELKVISLCHQHRARPACTAGQSDQTLYYWLLWTSNSYLGIPKIDNGQFRNGRWIIPCKKFSRLRVKPYSAQFRRCPSNICFAPFFLAIWLIKSESAKYYKLNLDGGVKTEHSILKWECNLCLDDQEGGQGR